MGRAAAVWDSCRVREPGLGLAISINSETLESMFAIALETLILEVFQQCNRMCSIESEDQANRQLNFGPTEPLQAV